MRTRSARRQFVLASLAAVPVLASCGTSRSESSAEAAEFGLERSRRRRPAPEPACEDAIEQERARWRRLYDLHVGAENGHELEEIMQTFHEQGEMIFNGLPFRDPDSIRAGHILYGFSALPGGLTSTQVCEDRITYTEDSILVHGRVVGVHVGDVVGFPPSGRRVEMHYDAFYRFDAAGKLVSERIVMDWTPLVPTA